MLDKLKLFVELAGTENVSRAAANLYTSQSTVSTQLKLLEGELGFPLFDRVGRIIRLNDNGRRFLVFANRTLESYDAFLSEVEVARASEPENLVICGGSYFIVYFLPYILPVFSKQHPNLSIHIVTRQSDAIIGEVMEKKYDFGIISSSKNLDRSALCIDFAHTSQLLCVCSPESALAKKSGVTAQEVNRETFIFTRKNSDYRTYLERKLARKGFTLENTITIESIEATKAATSNNLGVTILPDYAVRQELESGQLVPLAIDGLSLTREICCIHNIDRPPDDISRKFIQSCADYMQRLKKTA